MSLLTVVQKALVRSNQTRPVAAFGSVNPMVAHFVELLEELGQETVLRFPGQRLKVFSSWTTVAAEDQGTLASLFDDEFVRIVEGTVYDSSTDLRIGAFNSDVVSAGVREFGVNGAFYNYELVEGRLRIFPAPPVGLTFTLTLRTINWVLHADTTTSQVLKADTDTFLLPESMLILGLRAKWLSEKGLSYAEQMRGFEGMLASYLSRGTSVQNLDLNAGDGSGEVGPRIVVQNGNWTL